MKSFLHSPKAKAEAKKAVETGQTKAKSANTPSSKKKAMAKNISKADAANAKWERPNLMALCRILAGDDLYAAALLFHILFLWRNRKKKFVRFEKEWIGHTREAWARASGLTIDEYKKRALPRVKKNCAEFLEFRAMGTGAHKKSYVHVDEIALKEAIAHSKKMTWEMVEAAWNGVGPGNAKGPANAYQKDI